MTTPRAPHLPPRLRRPLAFLAVGLLNTAVGYAIFAAALAAGAPPRRAVAVQFLLGVLWNFATHRSLVFGTGGLARLPLYAAGYLLIYGVNIAALEALMRAGFGPLAAQALAMPGIVVLSYVIVARALGAAPPQRERAAT
ncbi:GtrA family protein [Frigidibacter oleivorans]|uniref:GtrA family protein n=1 Tax=Frigidibacter oleivorans TaxID=2487129 RepID=UPI001F1853A2|nr:GtrA family protein [Frigidibacter oleivorans]